MISRTHRCDPCDFETQVVGTMQDPPRTNCPICGQDTFLARIRKFPKAKFGQTLKNDGLDYREDLSRFPGDPEALVDGPRALKKLKDKRQREGWQFRSISEARSASPPQTDPNRDLVLEAYRAAEAKGFPEE